MSFKNLAVQCWAQKGDGWGLAGLTMSAIFNFQSVDCNLALLICTCVYVQSLAFSLLDRNKLGCWVYFGSVPELVNGRVLMLHCAVLRWPSASFSYSSLEKARIPLPSHLNMTKKDLSAKNNGKNGFNPFISEWLNELLFGCCSHFCYWTNVLYNQDATFNTQSLNKSVAIISVTWPHSAYVISVVPDSSFTSEVSLRHIVENKIELFKFLSLWFGNGKSLSNEKKKSLAVYTKEKCSVKPQVLMLCLRSAYSNQWSALETEM